MNSSSSLSNEKIIDDICQRVLDIVRSSLSDMKPEIIEFIIREVLEEVDMAYSARIQTLEEHMAYLERNLRSNN